MISLIICMAKITQFQANAHLIVKRLNTLDHSILSHLTLTRHKQNQPFDKQETLRS